VSGKRPITYAALLRYETVVVRAHQRAAEKLDRWRVLVAEYHAQAPARAAKRRRRS